MLVNFDMSGVLDQPFHCDLQKMCGSRYNAFSPDTERRDPPGKFFLRETWKRMRPAGDEETDRWDWLE